MTNKNSLFTCRKLEKRDFNQISIIEEDAFPELFPKTQFEKELQRKQSTTLVSILSFLNQNYFPNYQLYPLI